MEIQVYQNMFETEREHWWSRARREVIFSCLRYYFSDTPPPRNALDVGCGTGFILEELSNFCEATGVDTSPEAVKFCHLRGFHRVTLANIQDMPVENKFDLVTFFDVLEHVDDDVAFLNRIGELLTPGQGHIFLTVPAVPMLWSGMDELNHHKRRYTRGSLHSALEKAGYQIESLTYFNSLLFPLALVERLILRGKSSSALKVPMPLINWIFYLIFKMEKFIAPRIGFPVGLSLICIARRAENPRSGV